MKLGDKLRSLRAVEGSLRGLGRSMTQQELATAMKSEIGRGLSQAYLSQIENGARPHLTHTTRELLARFFRVYPGFLVDDPEGYTPGLQSELRAIDAKIDSWLFAGAEQFTADPVLQRALLDIAEHEDSRRAILLLAEILRTPDLAERLGEVLHHGNHQNGGQKGSGHPPPAALRNGVVSIPGGSR
jgi:transcriptional regulator with XRE-family HTH domain